MTTLLAVNPSDPWAHAFKVYLLRLEGRPEQAVAEGEQSVALNPGFAQPISTSAPLILTTHRKRLSTAWTRPSG